METSEPEGACPEGCSYACGPESECWRLQQQGASEKSSYLVGYGDALQWVLDNIGALDDADRERIESMRDA